MARLSVAERPAGYPAAGARDVHVGRERPHLTLVAACPSAPPVLREEELVRLWEGQRFPPGALTTRRGEALQVVYRGRRSPGAGPDFADAIIADDRGRLLKGDIELHVRASDFRGHGHHHDTRYDNLVLHVVFEDDEEEDTRLLCGRRVAVVALAPWVARRREQLRLWLAQPALWEEPCRGAVARLGEREVREIVSRLGRLRFHQKQSRFAAALGRAGANQVLYEGLLRALGYSQNAESFAALARLLPYERLRTALAAADGLVRGEALLLGTAGLLPAGNDPILPPSPYLRELERRWAAERGRLLGPPLSLCATSGLRPANQPARRLAGAARLLRRRGPSLVGSLRDLMTVGEKGPLRPLIAGWEVPAEGFWATHYDPGGGPAGPLGALVGRGRALELLINVVLPFAAAWGEARGLTALSRQALALFQRLPRSGSYGAIRFLESSLSGKGGGGACYQQGLLYLYRQYCTQGGCGACPFSRDEG
jgi:hypothetical protein